MRSETLKRGREVMAFAWPNALTYLVQNAIQTGSSLFVGHLGKGYMGAATLANMMCNLTGNSVAFGLASALDPLCSQAVGAKQWRLVGLQAQRAMFILTACCLPLALIWMQTEQMLLWMGMDREVSALAGGYAHRLIIGMWPAFIFEILKRWLQAQKVVWPVVVSAFFTAILNVVNCYVFIYKLDMGFYGAAYSNVIANWLLMFFLGAISYLRYRHTLRFRTLLSIAYHKQDLRTLAHSSSTVDINVLPPSPASPADDTTVHNNSSGVDVEDASPSSATPAQQPAARSKCSVLSAYVWAFAMLTYEGFAGKQATEDRGAERLEAFSAINAITTSSSSSNNDINPDEEHERSPLSPELRRANVVTQPTIISNNHEENKVTTPRVASITIRPIDTNTQEVTITASATTPTSSSFVSTDELKIKSNEIDAASNTTPAQQQQLSMTEEEQEEVALLTQSWPTWDRNSICNKQGIVLFFRLGLPAAASLFLEWGSFEVTASLAGRLGILPLDVHTVFVQTSGLWYMFPLGVANACSTLIGTMLGAGRAKEAAAFARMGVIINAIYGIVNGFLWTVVLRYYWVGMFTSDGEVVAAAVYIFPIMWLYGFWDASKCVTTGILRGCGRPSITVVGNLLACVFVGYPIAFSLIFTSDLGVLGLWLAMSSAWMVATIIYGVVIFVKTDWEKEVQHALDRNAQSAGQLTHPVEEVALASVAVDSSTPTSSDEVSNIEVKPSGFSPLPVVNKLTTTHTASCASKDCPNCDQSKLEKLRGHLQHAAMMNKAISSDSVGQDENLAASASRDAEDSGERGYYSPLQTTHNIAKLEASVCLQNTRIEAIPL